MSLREQAVQRRKQELTVLLHEEPRTVKEMVSVFGGSYQTMWRMFDQLLKEGVIVNCGLRAGSQVYTANKGATTGWPMVFDTAGLTDGRTLKEQVNSVRREDYITAAVRSAFRLELMAVDAIIRAQDAKQNDFDKTSALAARVELREALAEVKALVNRSECILRNDELWLAAGLNRVAAVDDFPAKNIIDGIEQIDRIVAIDAFNAMIKTIQQQRKEQYKNVSDSSRSNGQSSAKLAGNAEVRSGNHVDVPSNGASRVEYSVRSELGSDSSQAAVVEEEALTYTWSSEHNALVDQYGNQKSLDGITGDTTTGKET